MPFYRAPMLERLDRFLGENSLDAVLVHKPANVLYFSGFSGTSGDLAVSRDIRRLFTDSRYVEQAKQTAPDFTVQRCRQRPIEEALFFLLEQGCRRIGFEGDVVTFDSHRRLLETANSTGELVSVRLDALRAIKMHGEIAKIRQAATIVDRAFAELEEDIKIGRGEIQIAAQLEFLMRKLGSERVAFETIVASGPRSALPHGLATERCIEPGDLIVIDFGAVFDGYHSDMTRTLCAGPVPDESRRIYDAVFQAQGAALDMVRAGVKARDVDAEARRVLAQFGLDEYFGHGLGHSVGLEIHEEPRLSPLAGDVVLEIGMVVTVEPGAYIPGHGGVRVEDLVVVTENGCEILSQTPKQLRIVGH